MHQDSPQGIGKMEKLLNFSAITLPILLALLSLILTAILLFNAA